MGRISDKTILEIKQQLRLSDVFAQYAKLTRKGSDWWVKCPFHGGGNERTPSCKIDDEKDHYYCFGCKASGSMFDLVMQMEHLDFVEAVKYLADKAGVHVEETGSNAGSREAQKTRDDTKRIYELYERLAKTFRWFLTSHPSGEKAREYLERRKVSPEMSEKFMLGYAPSDKDFLKRFLNKNGYEDEILQKSGLFSQNHFPWPLFRDRIMFPVRDFRGHTVAFSGRDLSGDEKAPKYINSPDTLIYHKKENVFGIYESLESLKQKDSHAILLEGNFDVVAMHQAGFTTAMAPLGTSFTNEQAKRIGRYTDSFELMFDSDRAGQDSTDKAINIVARNGMTSRIHRLTSCKDAGETVEKLGEQQLRNEFEPSQSSFEYLVEKYKARYNIMEPGGKNAFLRAFSSYLEAQQSQVEKDTYILELSSMLRTGEDAVRQDLERLKSDDGRWRRDEVADDGPMLKALNTAAVSEEMILMLHLAVHPEWFEKTRMHIKIGDLSDPDAQKIYIALENALRVGIKSRELLSTYIDDPQLKAYVTTAYALEEFQDAAVTVIDELEKRIRLNSVERKQSAVLRQIEIMEHDGDEDAVLQLMMRKLDLDKEAGQLRAELYGLN